MRRSSGGLAIYPADDGLRRDNREEATRVVVDSINNLKLHAQFSLIFNRFLIYFPEAADNISAAAFYVELPFSPRIWKAMKNQREAYGGGRRRVCTLHDE